MTRNVKDFWKTVENIANGSRIDFAGKFIDRENARHNLVDGMDTPHQDIRQEHFDLTEVGGTRGCFQRYMHNAAADNYQQGLTLVGDENKADSNVAFAYAFQGFDGAGYAVDFFGERMSVARETEIRNRLVAGIQTRFVENDPRFTTWLGEFDDCSLTVIRGSVMVQVNNEVPTTVRSTSLMFDAVGATLTFTDYRDSDSPSSIDFTIAAGFKGVLSMTGDNGTTEVINNSVKGTYSFSNDDWRSNAAKVGDNPRAILALNREDS